MLLSSLALACLGPGCSGPPTVEPELSESGLSARDEDLMLRLVEALARAGREDPMTLLNALEHLLPAWQKEQRKGRADALEVVLTSRVIPHYENLAEMFRSGPHERRLVAAWALGFTKVPENDLGIPTHHVDARKLLVSWIDQLPDDVLANALLGLWVLSDPETPMEPITDLIVNHHDALVRANATLLLGNILDESRARSAAQAVLVGLVDSDATVRVHAATIARRFPDNTYLSLLESRILEETTPLAQARMASALGAHGSRGSAIVLVPLLRSEHAIVGAYAHGALVTIFGRDLGTRAIDWAPVLEGDDEG